MSESYYTPNLESNPMPHSLPIGVEPKPGYELVPRNEDGFIFMAPMAINGLKSALKIYKLPMAMINASGYLLGKLGVPKPRLVSTVSMGLTIATATSAFAYTRSENFIDADVDYSKTVDTANVSLFDYSKVGDIRVAVATSQIELTRQNTKYKLATPGIDVIPDFVRTKHMESTVSEEIFVPLLDDPQNKVEKAITQTVNPVTGKIDILVDMNKVTANVFYPGSGPEVTDGQMNKGEFDPSDGQEFKDSLISFLGAGASLVNIDNLTQVIGGIDKQVNAKIRNDGLVYVLEQCSNGLMPIVKETIKEKLAADAVVLGGADKMGEITFTVTKNKWIPKTDPYTNKIVKNGTISGALDKKNNGIDKKTINCDYSAVGASK